MSDPFRDGMEAAVQRSEVLEEENELLREEIARIREQAAAMKSGAASPEASELADKALDVLDQLEAVSKRPNKVRVALETKLTGEMRPLDAVTPEAAPAPTANDLEIARRIAPAPAPPPRPAQKSNAVFWVGAIMFAIGILVGRCMS